MAISLNQVVTESGFAGIARAQDYQLEFGGRLAMACAVWTAQREIHKVIAIVGVVRVSAVVADCLTAAVFST